MRSNLDSLNADTPSPTQGDIINSQVYTPSTADVAGAYVDDAFNGIGSLNYSLNASKVNQGVEITEDEYKNSDFYRHDINYYAGMTKKGSEILFNNKTNQETRDFIKQSGSTSQNIAGFVLSVPPSLFEPRNLAEGLAIGAVTEGLGVVKLFGSVAKNFGTLQRTLAMGAVQSVIQSTADIPTDIYFSKKMQDEYTVADGLTNFALDLTLGAGIDLTVNKLFKPKNKTQPVESQQPQLKSQLYKNIETQAKQYGLNPDLIHIIGGAESNLNDKAVNKNTKAFGIFQFTKATAKEYGITEKSTQSEQIDAMLRYTTNSKKIIETKLNRAVSDNEIYMGHVFGATGAMRMLESGNNEKFLDVAKKYNLYVGKNGDSYAKLVMTQNGLPENATVKEIYNWSTDRLNISKSRIGNPNGIISNNDADILDTAISQIANGNKLDLTAIHAKQHSENLKDSEIFLKETNKKFIKQSEKLKEKLEKDLFDNAIDSNAKLSETQKLYDDTLLDYEINNKFRIDQYEESLKTNTNNTEFYNFDNSFKSEIEIQRQYFKKSFDTIKNLKTKYDNLSNEVLNFNIKKRSNEILTENNNTVNQEFERQSLKSNRLKPLNKETKRISNDLNEKSSELKASNNKDDMSLAMQTAQNELKSKSIAVKKLEAKIRTNRSR
jgi:hypothetical protein